MILLGLLAAVSHAGIVVTAPPSSASTAPAAGATTLYGTNSWVVVEHGTQYVYQVVHTPNDTPGEGEWETITNLVYDLNNVNIAGPIEVNRTDVRRVRFLRTVASPIDGSTFKVDGAINFDNIDIVRKDSIAVTPR